MILQEDGRKNKEKDDLSKNQNDWTFYSLGCVKSGC